LENLRGRETAWGKVNSQPDKSSVAIWGDSGWSAFLQNSKGVNSTRVALLDIVLVKVGLLGQAGDETSDENASSIGLVR
jgi:hypothetical protein